LLPLITHIFATSSPERPSRWPKERRWQSCARCLLTSHCVLFSFVTVAKAAPYVIQNLTDLEVNISGKIILECKVSGTPEPQITWRKNGYPISAASGGCPCFPSALRYWTLTQDNGLAGLPQT